MEFEAIACSVEERERWENIRRQKKKSTFDKLAQGLASS